MSRRFVLAVLYRFAWLNVSHAQEVRNMSVDELTADADAVVIGNVTGTQSVWSDPLIRHRRQRQRRRGAQG